MPKRKKFDISEMLQSHEEKIKAQTEAAKPSTTHCAFILPIDVVEKLKALTYERTYAEGKRISQGALVTEALNDLFKKYGK